MKALGYRHVHIFFIPMFGAATSGIETNPSGAKKALIALLGPLPGIIIGIVLAIVYLNTGNELLIEPARTFLIINAFNLLPFYPLDGGRLIESLMTVKSLALEICFKTLSAFGLIAVLLFFGMYIGLGALTALLIVTLVASIRISSTARAIADQLPVPGGGEYPSLVPVEYISAITAILKKKWIINTSPKALAGDVHLVWLRLWNRPPAKEAIALFLLLYIFSVGIGITAPVFFEVAVAKEKAGQFQLELEKFQRNTGWTVHDRKR